MIMLSSKIRSRCRPRDPRGRRVTLAHHCWIDSVRWLAGRIRRRAEPRHHLRIVAGAGREPAAGKAEFARRGFDQR